MSRNRKSKHAPGDIYFSEAVGGYVRVTDHGEEEPWEPGQDEVDPYAGVAEGRDPTPEELHAFLHAHDAPDPRESLRERNLSRRADGTIAPFFSLDQEELELCGQETPRTRRTRHDGWTAERQKDFVERLAETASWTDAARFVGLTRQSARRLYNRSPQFRAACDDALRLSVGILAETAFDRAVNGVQEQVWYKGRMVGFREKYNDRLLMFLLRVRDPLNYAPLDDLKGWQRYRALEQNEGIEPTLDRLEAAEQAWGEAEHEPPALPQPADRLNQAALSSPAVELSLPLASLKAPPPACGRGSGGGREMPSHVEPSEPSPPAAPGGSEPDAERHVSSCWSRADADGAAAGETQPNATDGAALPRRLLPATPSHVEPSEPSPPAIADPDA